MQFAKRKALGLLNQSKDCCGTNWHMPISAETCRATVSHANNAERHGHANFWHVLTHTGGRPTGLA